MNVHTKSRLTLKTSADTPARDQGPGGACPDRTRTIPCIVRAVTTTRTRTRRCQASGANGSHGNERLPDCLDVFGQPTGTRSRSRTDLNTTGGGTGIYGSEGSARRVPDEVLHRGLRRLRRGLRLQGGSGVKEGHEFLSRFIIMQIRQSRDRTPG